jgi:hypothetical protein
MQPLMDMTDGERDGRIGNRGNIPADREAVMQDG